MDLSLLNGSKDTEAIDTKLTNEYDLTVLLQQRSSLKFTFFILKNFFIMLIQCRTFGEK